MNTKTKKIRRQTRHTRVRAMVSGTSVRPRITVFRSNQFIYAQVIDDITGKTLISTSDKTSTKTKTKKGTKVESATAIGTALAGLMKAKKISEAVFDRSGFKYHGRVKAVADGLREGGIKI